MPLASVRSLHKRHVWSLETRCATKRSWAKLRPEQGVPGLGTVIEALVALGLRRSDAERAAAKAKEELGDVEPQKLIPLALKYASNT